jgi:hypothetical protein
MSKASWKIRAARCPLIHSSAIALHQEDGRDAWLSTANILGAPLHNVPPMFKINRDQLEQAIEDGFFPKPFRVITNGPRGPLLWQSKAIRAYVEQLEAMQATAKLAAEVTPEGWSTTADLVKLLGVSRQTVRNLYTRGTIPRPKRFRGKPAWSPEQVHKILVAMGEEE